MNKELFQDCINRLRAVPDNKFNINWWTSADGSNAIDKLAALECSTVGCVLGWCCIWYPDKIYYSVSAAIPVLIREFSDKFPPEIGMRAGATLFDISEADARYLLSSVSYSLPPTVGEVADRMQAFLDRKVQHE